MYYFVKNSQKGNYKLYKSVCKAFCNFAPLFLKIFGVLFCSFRNGAFNKMYETTEESCKGKKPLSDQQKGTKAKSEA